MAGVCLSPTVLRKTIHKETRCRSELSIIFELSIIELKTDTPKLTIIIVASATTFFSYSRTDSVFVLKLAKDLRDAGVELWIDQLNIKAGSRWDESVEAAINSASEMIVILSPASVVSKDVLDEISFALKIGKAIIPVLLKECNTPLRLIRLQQVDFTGDYTKGLNQLIVLMKHNALSNAKTEGIQNENELVHVKAVDEAPVDEQQRKKENIWLRRESKKTNTALQYKKFISIAAGIVVLVLIVYSIFKLNSHKSNKELEDTSTLRVGVYYQGGMIFYIFKPGDKGYEVNVRHGLIVTPHNVDTADNWSNAVKICADLLINGFDDWYLPSKEELDQLFENNEKIGGFYFSFYWSSTAIGFGQAYARLFYGEGLQVNFDRISRNHIRAIRAF